MYHNISDEEIEGLEEVKKMYAEMNYISKHGGD